MRLVALLISLLWLYAVFRYLVPSGDPAALGELDLKAAAPTLGFAFAVLLLIWLLASQARIGRRLRRVETTLRGQGEAIAALTRLPAELPPPAIGSELLLAVEEAGQPPEALGSRRSEDDLLAPFSGENGEARSARPSARLSPARYLALERQSAAELEEICRRLAARLVPSADRERAERHRGRGEREVIFEQVAHALRDRRRAPQETDLDSLFLRYCDLYEDLAAKAEASDASGDSVRRVLESGLGQVYRRIRAAQDARVEGS